RQARALRVRSRPQARRPSSRPIQTARRARRSPPSRRGPLAAPRARGRPPRRSSGVPSLDLSADDHRRDPKGWLSVGDRRALAILAARARRIPKIPPDHVDLAHELWALADERRAAQRLSELPVADAVTLGDLEGEVAAHDVDLPTAHLLHEDAVLDRAHDLFGVRVAGGDHGVGHPADRQMPKTLAPGVAAAADAELLGMLPVGQIRLED